jgi:hypothetical protein
LAGFEPGILCSGGGRDDHFAKPPGPFFSSLVAKMIELYIPLKRALSFCQTTELTYVQKDEIFVSFSCGKRRKQCLKYIKGQSEGKKKEKMKRYGQKETR